MTTPGQNMPDDGISSGSIGGLNNLSEATWRANQFGKIEGFDVAHDNFNIGGMSTGIADLVDGQLALIGQIDQLGDVAGYCNLTMSNSYRISFGGTVWIGLPFNTYVTQHKNAVHNSGIQTRNGTRHGIEFTGPGTWDISTTVTLSEGSGSAPCDVALVVYRSQTTNGPINQLWSESVFATRIGGSPVGVDFQKPVIVPDDSRRYAVVCEVRMSNVFWWTVRGGTRESSLSVRRLNLDTTDYGAPEAPGSGGDYT